MVRRSRLFFGILTFTALLGVVIWVSALHLQLLDGISSPVMPKARRAPSKPAQTDNAAAHDALAPQKVQVATSAHQTRPAIGAATDSAVTADARTNPPTSAPTTEHRSCTALQQQYGVQVGSSWGSLPAQLQQYWKQQACDNKINSAAVSAACVSWRQTADCDPKGAREPQRDLACTVTIISGSSGYCDCGARKIPSACNHQPFNCGQLCSSSTDPSFSGTHEQASLTDPL